MPTLIYHWLIYNISEFDWVDVFLFNHTMEPYCAEQTGDTDDDVIILQDACVKVTFRFIYKAHKNPDHTKHK